MSTRAGQFLWLIGLGISGLFVLLYLTNLVSFIEEGAVTAETTAGGGEYTIGNITDFQQALQGNIHWMLGSGTTFLERVDEYGQALSSLRTLSLSSMDTEARTQGAFEWIGRKRKARPILANVLDTLFQLQADERIRTLALAWFDGKDAEDTSRMDRYNYRNLLVHDYYRVAESRQMCLAKLSKETRSDAQCPANQTVPLAAECISLVALNPKNTSRSEHVPPSSNLFRESINIGPLPHMLYVHVLHNAVVDTLGDVFKGDIKIIPFGCRARLRSGKATLPAKASNSILHDEVFVMSQFWGYGPYHFLCEDLPRVAPYREFLIAHPEIKVHVMSKGSLTVKALEFLGISRSRLVSGLCRARTVYLPQGTPCGRVNVHLAQLLSHQNRMAIRGKYPPEMLQRNSIVVIKRTKKRMFKKASQIESTVKRMAEENGFRFELFTDKPLPKFEEIALMFSRAVVVVAPHGAGISNVLFSEPGTFVIEGVCNPPNICYEDLAYKLGHRYHGVMTSGGCHRGIGISSETIAEVLKIYIDRLKAKTIL